MGSVLYRLTCRLGEVYMRHGPRLSQIVRGSYANPLRIEGYLALLPSCARCGKQARVDSRGAPKRNVSLSGHLLPYNDSGQGLSMQRSTAPQALDRDWFTVRQAAEYLQVSTRTIFRYIDRGTLAASQLVTNGSVRVSTISIEKLLEKNEH